MATAENEVREPDPRFFVPATLVDSCVLIDVLSDDPTWADWSIQKLEALGGQAPLVINPLILAEISPRFARVSDLEAALDILPLQKQALPWDAAFLAGQAFKVYRQSKGMQRSPMPDFYIGAHALLSGMRLLTRDAKRYRTYFPKLHVVCPESSPLI
jgi:predicted nucleic acid-binding protein